MPNLRPGQYKRLGRISESNPERAERVAERMNRRASREERGKEIANGSGRAEAKKMRNSLFYESASAESPKKPNRDYPLSATPEPDRVAIAKQLIDNEAKKEKAYNERRYSQSLSDAEDSQNTRSSNASQRTNSSLLNRR